MVWKNKLIWFAVFALFLWAVLLVAIFLLPMSLVVRNGLLLAISISTVNGVLMHGSLHWAFPRSNKIFFGAFFGGMGWKLLSLALTAGFIFRNSSYHLAITLVALSFFSLFFTFLSLRFLPTPKINHGF